MEQTAYDSILLFGPIPENLKNEIATYLENIYGISHLSLGDSQRKYEEKCENTENQEETKTELEGKKILLIARELGSNNDLLQDKPMIISFSESQIIYENANNQQFLNRLLKYYHNPIFFFSENPNPVTPKKAFKFTLFKQPIEPISQEKKPILPTYMKMKATINIYGKSIEQIMDEITANIENLEKKPSTRSKTMEE